MDIKCTWNTPGQMLGHKTRLYIRLRSYQESFLSTKKGMKVETNYMQIRKFTKYVEIKYATEPVCQQKKTKIKYLK